MADYFFTDPDLLLPQDTNRIADRFGYVKTTQNKFSVTSLHRGRVIPFLDPEDSSKISSLVGVPHLCPKLHGFRSAKETKEERQQRRNAICNNRCFVFSHKNITV